MKTPVYELKLIKTDTVKDETKKRNIRGSIDAAAMFEPLFEGATVEKFAVIGLDARNKPLGMSVISVGTLTQSLVHPREVMRPLILMGAACFMIAHNHPSGETSPSADDDKVTKKMKAVAELLSMPLLDHLIMPGGFGKYFSYSDSGKLQNF